ncbi:MAG: AAA family ATPase [Patescibacteria group bacterium]|jgi:adenylate kinase family enzyme|nr:AAA family ATPase [Patescibacteria group bacterium]
MLKRNLIVVCGPTASGKTTVSKMVQKRAKHKIAYFDHDYWRETVFSKAKTESKNLRFEVELTAVLLALNYEWDVILDTTLSKVRLAKMLGEITKKSNSKIYKFYLDVSLEESKIRHNNREKSAEFGTDFIDKWYSHFDVLKPGSTILEQDLTIQEKANIILNTVYGE